MSSMKLCKHCGKEIAKSANICPHCGGKNAANGCLVAVIVFVVILFFGAIGRSRNPSSSGSSSYKSSISNTNSGSSASSGTAENTPREIKAVPGEMVRDDHFEIYYLSCSEYTSTNMYSSPSEGKKYVKFDFTFKNISDTDTTLGSFECYCNNAKCDSSYVDSSTVPRLTWESVSGGREISGSVVYEVPQSAALSDVELEYAGFFDNKKADKIIFVGQ